MKIQHSLAALSTVQATNVELNNGYFVSTTKSKNAADECTKIGGFLPEITDTNKDLIASVLRKGKYTVDGATKEGKCNFYGRNKRVIKNKKCRNTFYVCDVTATPRKPPCEERPVSLDENHYSITFVDSPEEAYTWHEARDKCREKGKDWDLAVFNNQKEYSMVVDYLEGKCYSSFDFWVGYQQTNGEVLTQYGRNQQWVDLPTGLITNSDRESCVEMTEGQLRNQRCGKTFSGIQSGMGFVCEKQPHTESCHAKDPEEIPEDKRYFFGEAEANSWSESRQKCQAMGVGWDLAVIDDLREHKKLVSMANCSPHAFWVGHTETNGTASDVNGNAASYLNSGSVWDTHSDLDLPEPNDQTGIEECVRLVGDKLHDAKCDLTSTGHARSGLGMAYICEFDQSKAAPIVAPRSIDLLPCDHNPNIKPWVANCAAPGQLACEDGPKLQIADSWKVRKNNKFFYGFVGTVHMPQQMAASPWSVLIRFSPLVSGHNFQIWNAKYWNFYNNNREVLFHKKWWNNDRIDQNSFSFVVENLDQPEYPEVVGFNQRVLQHSCFDRNMHAGHRSASLYHQTLAQKVSADVAGTSVPNQDMNKLMMEASEQVTKIRVNKRGKMKIKDNFDFENQQL